MGGGGGGTLLEGGTLLTSVRHNNLKEKIGIMFWTMIEKVMNTLFLKKSKNDSCNGFCTILPLLRILLVQLYSCFVIQGHTLC